MISHVCRCAPKAILHVQNLVHEKQFMKACLHASILALLSLLYTFVFCVQSLTTLKLFKTISFDLHILMG